MKVKVGDKVGTIDFGVGPIVAMSAAWCVVKVNPKAMNGKGEVAVTWDQVFVTAEPGEAGSTLEGKDVPSEQEDPTLRSLLAEALGDLGDGGGLGSNDLIVRAETYLAEHPAGSPFDYRELLKKYINLVGEEEGVTFISHAKTPKFSLEEIAELKAIEAIEEKQFRAAIEEKQFQDTIEAIEAIEEKRFQAAIGGSKS